MTFEDYNLRAYGLRRCRMGFEEARGEADPAAVQALLAVGKEQLKVLQRQGIISNMYSTDQSVMVHMGKVSRI
jgi:hypothetical protein